MRRYKRCRAVMTDLARSLHSASQAEDPRFQTDVYLTHSDGTLMFLRHAFIERHLFEPPPEITGQPDDGDIDFVIVISEHQGFYVFDGGDLTSVKVHKRIPSPNVIVRQG